MKKISAVLLAFALAASLGTACKGKATCESAVDHMMDIMPEQFKAMMKKEDMGKQKAKAVKECKNKKTSQAELDCAVAAKDLEAVQLCKGKK